MTVELSDFCWQFVSSQMSACLFNAAYCIPLYQGLRHGHSSISSFMSSWLLLCSMKILCTLISHWYAHTVWILWIYILFLFKLSVQSLIMFPLRLSYIAVCLRFRQSASLINNAATTQRWLMQHPDNCSSGCHYVAWLVESHFPA